MAKFAAISPAYVLLTTTIVLIIGAQINEAAPMSFYLESNAKGVPNAGEPFIEVKRRLGLHMPNILHGIHGYSGGMYGGEEPSPLIMMRPVFKEEKRRIGALTKLI